MLNERSLERSAVVANSRMNRERIDTGVNSYERELGLGPIEFLATRCTTNEQDRELSDDVSNRNRAVARI
jgi:hypothetical protein